MALFEKYFVLMGQEYPISHNQRGMGGGVMNRVVK